MNKIELITTEYIISSRTLEILSVSDSKVTKVMFMYNKDGIYFYLFNRLLDFIDFLDNKLVEYVSFEYEMECDTYLQNLKLS